MNDPKFNRLSSANTPSNLGPLEALVGTWKGNSGWNVVALPDKNNPDTGFILLLQKYQETITFTSLGGKTPNRGPKGTQLTYGLEYELSINDLDTGEPLHKENGMWLIASNPSGEFPIARQSSVPHGDVLLAQGTYETIQGAPTFPVFDVRPIGSPSPLGYGEGKYNSISEGGSWSAPFPSSNFNEALAMDIKDQTILSTTHISVNSKNQGGVLSIPFVTRNANITAFDADYYIETVKGSDGSEFLQLQYTQNSVMEFMKNIEGPNPLIIWPHGNVNTLRKQ